MYKDKGKKQYSFVILDLEVAELKPEAAWIKTLLNKRSFRARPVYKQITHLLRNPTATRGPQRELEFFCFFVI